MERWTDLQALVFDLDGTLYDSPELLAAYPRLAIEVVAERLGLSREQAEERFEAERQAIRRARGVTPSTTQTLLDLAGLNLDEWEGITAARIDPATYLDPRDYVWLPPLLARLHRFYRLGIVSNNNRVLTERILRLLGIQDLFDAILTISESRRIKPDPTLYLDIACLLGVEPAACLSIGDRLDIDIVPAQQAGMRGVLIGGPRDLLPLGEELIAAAGAREPAW